MRSETTILAPEFEPLHAVLLDSLPDGVWFADQQGVIRFWSKRAESITGFTANEVLGVPFGDILSYCDETGGSVPLALLGQTLQDERERRAPMFFLHKQGHRIAVEVQTTPVRSSTGEVIGAREILRESKDKPALLRRGRVLHQYGLWDEKIESASQEYMRNQLDIRLDHFREDGIATGALLIDIDHLGNQDRNLGREASDHLLAMVSRTTLLCIRFTDISGRWEDDSILAIMEASTSGNLETAAERMRALISASSIRWWGQVVGITVTIGCTMFVAEDTSLSVMERLAKTVETGSKAGGDRVLVL
jgi:PAS domain S-box-containing protein/diguanylate cyclase (GGDEF)-like protein